MIIIFDIIKIFVEITVKWVLSEAILKENDKDDVYYYIESKWNIWRFMEMEQWNIWMNQILHYGKIKKIIFNILLLKMKLKIMEMNHLKS